MFMDSAPHQHQRGLAGVGLQLLNCLPAIGSQVGRWPSSCPVRHERQFLDLLIKRDKKGKILHFPTTANASGAPRPAHPEPVLISARAKVLSYSGFDHLFTPQEREEFPPQGRTHNTRHKTDKSNSNTLVTSTLSQGRRTLHAMQATWELLWGAERTGGLW